MPCRSVYCNSKTIAKLEVTYKIYDYFRNLRATRNLEVAGEPGGVCKFESFFTVQFTTVNVCLKSNGDEICAESRFNNYKKLNNKINAIF